MVLNLTRYPNSLVLMSQYIAEEQNVLANFQLENKFEKLLSSYSQVTIKFKPKKKVFKNNFLKNETTEQLSANRSGKTCLFPDAFRLSVSPQIFFSPRCWIILYFFQNFACFCL